MIISEVLDAIDNINSITLESEISMCESLLSSYDKMLIIEENYNGDDIDGFQIFQEASKMDLVKEDLKKQNKGKSTLNKIIFTIPRLIRSLIRLIMGKLKKTTSLVESIKDDVNSSNEPKNEKSKNNRHIVQTTALYCVLGLVGTGGIYAGVKGFKHLKEYLKEKKNNKQKPIKDKRNEAANHTKEDMRVVMDLLENIDEVNNGNSDKTEAKTTAVTNTTKAEDAKKETEPRTNEEKEAEELKKESAKTIEAKKAEIDSLIKQCIKQIRDTIPEDHLKKLNINLDNIKTADDIKNIIQLINNNENKTETEIKELKESMRKMSNEHYDLSILKPVKDFFSNLSDETFEKYYREYTRLIDQIGRRHEKKIHRRDGSYEIDTPIKPNITIYKNQVVINMQMHQLKPIIKNIKEDIDDINNDVKKNNITFGFLDEKTITGGAKDKIYAIYKNGLDLTSLNESFNTMNDKTIRDSVSEMNQSFEEMVDNVNKSSLSDEDKKIIRSNIIDIELRICVVEMAIDDYNDLCSIHKNFQDMCNEANIIFEKSTNNTQSINNTSSKTKTITKADTINDANKKQLKKSDIPKEEKEFKEFINKGKAVNWSFDDFNKFYLNNTYTKYEFNDKNGDEIAKAKELKKKYILDPLSKNFSTEVIKSVYDLDKAHKRTFIERYNDVTKSIAQCLSDHNETDIAILETDSKRLCEFIDQTTNPNYDYRKWV
jgi:hypothetical protein